MKILVFSDSHGVVKPMTRAVAMERPDHIIHLGDVLRDAQMLAHDWPDIPMTCVAGNCDGCVGTPAELVLELGGKRLFITHGHPYHVKMGHTTAIYAALEQEADALFYGHTHQAYCRQEDDGLWVMNPGPAGGWGERSYGVVWIEQGQMGCYLSPLERTVGGELLVKETAALDMTQGNPAGLILRFSLPLLVGNVLQQLYNMVDSMVVGQFVGSAALAAVGTAFPILFLLSSLFIGLGMGAMVVISQYIGAGDRSSAARAVDTIYSALQVVILPLTGLGLLVCGPLLRLIQVPADAYNGAYLYCMVAFAGVVGVLGYNLNAGIMQGLGDSRTTLIFLAVACVLNIVLDLAFVVLLPWGVFGVALATVIAQISSWLFGIFYINRKYRFLRIRLLRIRVDRPLLRQIVRLGVPSAVHQCQFAVAILPVQTLINGVGTDFAAGFSAANKIDTFAFMPIQSFGAALTAYVGQNMGAGRLDRVRRGLRSTLLLGVGTSLTMGWLVILFRRPLLSLFNREPAVIAGEAYLLRVLSLMFLFAIMFTLDSTLRGAGSMVVPMVSSVAALWGVRLPAAFLLAHMFGPEQLYWSYPIGWIVGLTISTIAYFRGKWKDACVVEQSESV